MILAQEKVAILIANADYKNTSRLKNPLNDLKELEKICIREKYKTYVYTNLTRAQFENFIDSLHNKISSETKKIYIHYSGHGIQIKHEDYFVPVDLPKIEFKSQLSQKCVQMSDLFDKLRDISARHNSIRGLITIDACRKFPLNFDEFSSGLVIPEYDSAFGNHFGLLYAVGPNQTASDGLNKTSPFVSAISRSFSNCLSISDMLKLVQLEYDKSYLNSKVRPSLHMNEDFSFCEFNNSGQYSKNWLEEYKDLIHEINEDFQNERFEKIKDRAVLVDQLLNHEKVSVNRESIEYLTYKYQKAIACFELGQINESRLILEELAVLKINGSNWELFKEATFHLAQIYTILKDFDSLLALRNKQLSYLISVKNNVSIALTFDKIAGDYEERELQDSALKYYKKAIEVIEICDLSKEENDQLAGLIYSNLGNCLRYGNNKDLTTSKKYLEKALICSKGNTELKRRFLFDLISIESEMPQYEIDRDIFEDQLREHLKLCREMNLKTQLLEHFDIAFTYHRAINDLTLMRCDFDSLQNIIFSDLKVGVLTDTIVHESYGQSCENIQRKIKLELPIGVLPNLFFDKNMNEIFDSQDYHVYPENATQEKTYPCILGENTNEQVIRFENTEIAQTSGIFYLHHNNKHLSDMISKESFCVAIPNGESVIWDFRIDCNELNINSENTANQQNLMYVGAQFILVADESNIISTTNLLRFTPIYNFDIDCTKFSLSTFDNN